MVDTSRIHSLISRARRRLKLQSAIDAAALSAILALASALVVIFAVRMEWVTESAGFALLAGCGGLVLLGALAGAMRRFPDHLVAQRIDRASNLSDRLGTATAFERSLAGGADADPDTRAMMEAAIRDASAHSAKADVVAATPFGFPRDSRAVVAFGLVTLLVAFLYWDNDRVEPFLTAGNVTLDGKQLPDQLLDGSEVDRGSLVFRDAGSGEEIVIELGATGPFRYSTELTAAAYSIHYRPNAEACKVGARSREHVKMPCVAGPVVEMTAIGAGLRATTPRYRLDCGDDSCTLDLDIKTKLIENPIELENDDLDYISDLLEDLRQTANTDDDASLKEFVKEVDDLLAKVEKGELTKEQLLDELRKAEEKFRKNTDQNMEETMADLEKTGEELKKEKLTRELGKALEKGDLEKAQQEMEKLAKQLENQELSEKERQKIAKAMEKAAEKFEKREQKKDKELDSDIKRQQKQVKKLKRQLKNEKNPEKREKMSRRLEKEKRELDRLQRKKQQRQQSQARRNLKELHRNMKSSAKDMQKNNPQDQKQASRRMRDMKRNTGKVDSDRRKIKTQKKVASQLTDLREAMRRAKKRGNRGPKDMFGKNRKNRDFGRRARGLSGKRGAWKPGQGKNGRGLGKNGKQPGGKGQKPGGDSYGDGHDPNLLDQPTAKSHDTQDESVSGIHGKGPSVRETILSAAQKGFASRSYKKVYASYKSIVEEVMQTEKVPSGYKYYIKRYFQKIKPHSMD